MKFNHLNKEGLHLKLFLAMQYREMKEHEYFIYEKYHQLYNQNIPNLKEDNIILHWVNYGYAKHFRERFEKHYQDYIDHICSKRCHYKCPGIERGGCKLSIDDIHTLLEDGPDLPYAEKRELFSEPGELELLLGESDNSARFA